MERIEEWIDYRIALWMDRVATAIGNSIYRFGLIIFSVMAIGMVGYILYQCIRMMFLQTQEATQKVLFGYFAFLLIKVCSVLIEVRIK